MERKSLDKKYFDSHLHSLGVSEKQIGLLSGHLGKAGRYIFDIDPGIKEGLVWLKGNIVKSLGEEDASVLCKIVEDNIPGGDTSYLEEGFDSCQSHRKLSKIVGEAVLLGGFVYEYGLLGVKLGLEGAKEIIGSNLKIKKGHEEMLTNIARKYGALQDFLFPGVTPTNDDTPSMDEYALKSLKGDPQTTVRTLTGVGGFRYDKDWNYATDIVTFIKLKVKEDKRYYPGLGILFFFLNNKATESPTLNLVKKQNPAAYKILESFVESIKKISKDEYCGVSILCSAFVPRWSEIKKVSGWIEIPGGFLEIAGAFHSPAYEFSAVKEFVERVIEGAEDSMKQLTCFVPRLSRIWTFNSTIHLPWTSELAGLSNDLIGRITNKKGDYGIKYGVGHNGKSVEIVEYHFGEERSFPTGLAGRSVYEARIYKESDCFKGPHSVHGIALSDPLWRDIQEKGFIKVALDIIKNEK